MNADRARQLRENGLYRCWITLYDRFHDNLQYAHRVLRRYTSPVAPFFPIVYLDESCPLPHEEHLGASSLDSGTLRRRELAELAAPTT